MRLFIGSKFLLYRLLNQYNMKAMSCRPNQYWDTLREYSSMSNTHPLECTSLD